MTAIQSCRLPAGALLDRYANAGAYADCYVAEIARVVSHAELVEAFYTSTVFKLERLILMLLASRPSSDAQAKQLAHGETDTFAAWSVESRAPNQVLLSDYTGRTRSWLMVATPESGDPTHTSLYFGSAVVPERGAAAGRTDLGFMFRWLLGFHKLYSRALLHAARARLSR
jgi:hypothetical protein